MDMVNLADKMKEAREKSSAKVDVYGTDNFRSWILYFEPGDGTDMHFHQSPETFLVVEGSGIVKGRNVPDRDIRKNDVLCIGARDYYQVTNTGTSPLVLFGNRSEGFGGAHVTADGTDARRADGSLEELKKA